MWYVYILKSCKASDRFYVGFTNDIERRIKEHASPTKDNYTYRFSPWKLETYIVFENRTVAKNFEAYLKTSSGRTFLKRHFFL